MRILLVFDFAPLPARSGITYAVANLIEQLQGRADLDLLIVGDDEIPEPHPFGSVFRCRPPCGRRKIVRIVNEIRFGHGFFLRTPDSNLEIPAELLANQYDFIFTSPSWMAAWPPFLAQRMDGRKPKLILGQNDSLTESLRRDVDLAVGPMLPPRQRLRHLLRAARLPWISRVERELYRPFDVVMVQSENDRQLIEQDCGRATASRVLVAPSGVREELFEHEYQYDAEHPRLVHLGSFSGNRGLLLSWFVRKVFPDVKKRLPAAELHLFGAIKEPDRQWLSQIPGVVVQGFANDVIDVFDGATLAIAPVFMRCGLITKAVDAMAAGVPCTGIGAFDGIPGFTNNVHGHQPQSRASWATEICDLLSSPPRLAGMSRAGRELVREELRWHQTIQRVTDHLQSLLDHPTGNQSIE